MTDTELTKMLRSSANRVVNYAADRIEALTAERDDYADQISNFLPAVNREAVEQRQRAEGAEADNARYLAALNQSRLAFAGHVSVQSAIDLIDRASLKGETP